MIANYANHAANERTFIAWIRTGLAVAAFGFFLNACETPACAVRCSRAAARLPAPSDR
jgi:uncharacterized membrane protein YidH (DUF202 family)